MPFIGQEPITGAFHKLDAITTSATATYNLQLNGGAYSPASANHLMVSLNGVIQAPQDSFTVSGSQIIFDSALTSSDIIDFIMAYGDVLNIGTPSDGTVNTNSIVNSAVTDAKIAGMSSSKLTGALPALDGSALTGLDPAIGVGQTWQLVTSSRAKDTEYQNTTGKPIMVSVSFTSNFTHRGRIQVSTTSGSGFFTIGEADGGDYYSATQTTTHYANLSTIIPDQLYYRFTGTDTSVGIQSWSELR